MTFSKDRFTICVNRLLVTVTETSSNYIIANYDFGIFQQFQITYHIQDRYFG